MYNVYNGVTIISFTVTGKSWAEKEIFYIFIHKVVQKHQNQSHKMSIFSFFSLFVCKNKRCDNFSFFWFSVALPLLFHSHFSYFNVLLSSGFEICCCCWIFEHCKQKKKKTKNEIIHWNAIYVKAFIFFSVFIVCLLFENRIIADFLP